jgi:hypothetical protein
VSQVLIVHINILRFFFSGNDYILVDHAIVQVVRCWLLNTKP